MSDALRAVRLAVDGSTTYFGLSLLANLVAVVLSLPFAAAVVYLLLLGHAANLAVPSVVVLFGILPNPVAAGLHEIADGLSRSDSFVEVRLVTAGVRRHAAITVRAWGVGVMGIALVVLNLFFYSRVRFPGSGVLALIWLYAAFMWLVVHVYVYPLLLRPGATVLGSYQAAFLLLLSRPGFTAVVALSWFLALLIGAATGLILLIGLAVAAAHKHAALTGATHVPDAPV